MMCVRVLIAPSGLEQHLLFTNFVLLARLGVRPPGGMAYTIRLSARLVSVAREARGSFNHTAGRPGTKKIAECDAFSHSLDRSTSSLRVVVR